MFFLLLVLAFVLRFWFFASPEINADETSLLLMAQSHRLAGLWLFEGWWADMGPLAGAIVSAVMGLASDHIYIFRFLAALWVWAIALLVRRLGALLFEPEAGWLGAIFWLVYASWAIGDASLTQPLLATLWIVLAALLFFLRYSIYTLAFFLGLGSITWMPAAYVAIAFGVYSIIVNQNRFMILSWRAGLIFLLCFFFPSFVVLFLYWSHESAIPLIRAMLVIPFAHSGAFGWQSGEIFSTLGARISWVNFAHTALLWICLVVCLFTIWRKPTWPRGRQRGFGIHIVIVFGAFYGALRTVTWEPHNFLPTLALLSPLVGFGAHILIKDVMPSVRWIGFVCAVAGIVWMQKDAAERLVAQDSVTPFVREIQQRATGSTPPETLWLNSDFGYYLMRQPPPLRFIGAIHWREPALLRTLYGQQQGALSVLDAALSQRPDYIIVNDAVLPFRSIEIATNLLVEHLRKDYLLLTQNYQSSLFQKR